MHIGVPKEIKRNEFRVGLTPDNVRELVSLGHTVYVESYAGSAIGYTDYLYTNAGAIVTNVNEVYEKSKLIIKVKEPQPEECARLNSDHILFTYLHLAADPEQAILLKKSGCTAIAYETVTGPNNSLPLLKPMSIIAGRMASQVGASLLQKHDHITYPAKIPFGASSPPFWHGVIGRGILMNEANIVIIGGGTAGVNAATVAKGMGATVTILDISQEWLTSLKMYFDNKVITTLSTRENILKAISYADIVIGAVLIPGASAPKLLTKDDLLLMKKHAVLIDIAIDQGGCFETSKPTTHDDPTYIVNDVIHYCVANMPGGVPLTSTIALTNETFPYVKQLAEFGLNSAYTPLDRGIVTGINIINGVITNSVVSKSLGFQ